MRREFKERNKVYRYKESLIGLENKLFRNQIYNRMVYMYLIVKITWREKKRTLCPDKISSSPSQIST